MPLYVNWMLERFKFSGHVFKQSQVYLQNWMRCVPQTGRSVPNLNCKTRYRAFCFLLRDEERARHTGISHFSSNCPSLNGCHWLSRRPLFPFTIVKEWRLNQSWHIHKVLITHDTRIIDVAHSSLSIQVSGYVIWSLLSNRSSIQFSVIWGWPTCHGKEHSFHN